MPELSDEHGARNYPCISDGHGFALSWNFYEILMYIINLVIQANPFAFHILVRAII